jgi:hypothetical protein
LTKLGTLLIRTVPIDEALEELLTERPGGDAQIVAVSDSQAGSHDPGEHS